MAFQALLSSNYASFSLISPVFFPKYRHPEDLHDERKHHDKPHERLRHNNKMCIRDRYRNCWHALPPPKMLFQNIERKKSSPCGCPNPRSIAPVSICSSKGLKNPGKAAQHLHPCLLYTSVLLPHALCRSRNIFLQSCGSVSVFPSYPSTQR